MPAQWDSAKANYALAEQIRQVEARIEQRLGQREPEPIQARGAPGRLTVSEVIRARVYS